MMRGTSDESVQALRSGRKNQRDICISQLLKAQGSICRALVLLRSSEAGIELYGNERQYAGGTR